MTLWTPEENQKLRDLMATGITTKVAAIALNRTHKSVAAHWSERNYSDQRRAQKRLRDNLMRRETKGAVETRGRLHVPDEVWAEREARLREKISLTASIFGDPVPSRSALAQRAVP